MGPYLQFCGLRRFSLPYLPIGLYLQFVACNPSFLVPNLSCDGIPCCLETFWNVSISEWFRWIVIRFSFSFFFKAPTTKQFAERNFLLVSYPCFLVTRIRWCESGSLANHTLFGGLYLLPSRLWGKSFALRWSVPPSLVVKFSLRLS